MQQRQRKLSTMFKRVKERSVQMAVEKVEEWRNLFQNGKLDNQGNLKKLTLQQAAEEVGIPKKTLEDYYQLIKKAKEIQPIEQLYDHKMGYLRQLIKQHFKQNVNQIESEDEIQVDSDSDDDFEYPIQQKNFDLEEYFDLENYYNYDQNSVVMNVHTRPQIIQIHSKKVDSWENETFSCDSDQETDDDEEF